MATSIFTVWATSPAGIVRRLEIPASTQAMALQLGFVYEPRAVAMSARKTEGPLRDALLQLDRRVTS